MPFKSQAQAKFMFSQHPEIAKEFASKTPSIKSLPQRTGLRGQIKKKKLVSDD